MMCTRLSSCGSHIYPLFLSECSQGSRSQALCRDFRIRTLQRSNPDWHLTLQQVGSSRLVGLYALFASQKKALPVVSWFQLRLWSSGLFSLQIANFKSPYFRNPNTRTHIIASYRISAINFSGRVDPYSLHQPTYLPRVHRKFLGNVERSSRSPLPGRTHSLGSVSGRCAVGVVLTHDQLILQTKTRRAPQTTIT